MLGPHRIVVFASVATLNNVLRSHPGAELIAMDDLVAERQHNELVQMGANLKQAAPRYVRPSRGPETHRKWPVRR